MSSARSPYAHNGRRRKRHTTPEYKWYMGSPFWIITLVYNQDIKLTDIPKPSEEFLDELFDRVYSEVHGNSTKDFNNFIRLLIKELQEYERDVHESRKVTSQSHLERRDTRQEYAAVTTTSSRVHSSDIHGDG